MRRAQELAAAARASPSVETFHSLAEHFMAEGAHKHAMAVYARAVALAHSGGAVAGATPELPVAPLRAVGKAHRVPLASRRERDAVTSILHRLEALQNPRDCSRAPVLLVALWPCCEGLASRVHTVAAALAQGVWTNATTIVVSAAALVEAANTPPALLAADALTLRGVEPLGLLLPIGSCTASAALDGSELAVVRAAVSAWSQPPPRPGEGRAALLMPPGRRRRAHLGAASRHSVIVLASEHFADVAALAAPPFLAPLTRSDGLLWLSTLLNY
eukprot:1944291-Prymnesium_polylepis.1